MTKYIENPHPPRIVEAVQFQGLVDGAPTFNEAVPGWVMAAFAQGTLRVMGEETLYKSEIVSEGEWLVVHGTLPLWDNIEVMAAVDFVASYRKLAKRARKEKGAAALSMAAE